MERVVRMVRLLLRCRNGEDFEGYLVSRKHVVMYGNKLKRSMFLLPCMFSKPRAEDKAHIHFVIRLQHATYWEVLLAISHKGIIIVFTPSLQEIY